MIHQDIVRQVQKHIGVHKMKIGYISDLHLDFWVKKDYVHLTVEVLKDTLNIQESDVLIIAGDLGHDFEQNKRFLLMAREYAKDVIIVNGNHDMYLTTRESQYKYKYDSMNRIKEMKKFCLSIPGFHYLDGETISLNGITFAGLGMSWDDFYYQKINQCKPKHDEIIKLFRDNINDSRYIFSKGVQHIYLPEYGFNHVTSFDPIKFFAEEKKKLKKINNVDVMVTHVGPIIPNDIREEYINNVISTFFYFDGVEDVIRIHPKHWIYGHTHDAYEHEFYGVKFHCNPLGYTHENTNAKIKYFEI